jgi:hypothetical protein
VQPPVGELAAASRGSRSPSPPGKPIIRGRASVGPARPAASGRARSILPANLRMVSTRVRGLARGTAFRAPATAVPERLDPLAHLARRAGSVPAEIVEDLLGLGQPVLGVGDARPEQRGVRRRSGSTSGRSRRVINWATAALPATTCVHPVMPDQAALIVDGLVHCPTGDAPSESWRTGRP